jgi:hypothetical protein
MKYISVIIELSHYPMNGMKQQNNFKLLLFNSENVHTFAPL